jgi:hypothetical protein
MSEIKECVACAEEIKINAKLCKHCGTDQGDSRWTPSVEGMVHLEPGEQRVSPGSMTPEEFDQAATIIVAVNSPEHLNSSAPFDPTAEPGALVPADCVWAVFPYPGPFDVSKLPIFNNAEKFFGSLESVMGWTFREFENYAGPPFNKMQREGGQFTAIWSTGGFFGAWSAAFHFDGYGVCMGVGTVTQF